MLLDLPELVYILVKFVDDIDVGQFLLNIEPTLINRNAGETFNTETDMMASYPNKCIFLNCLFYWSDYLRVEDNERELLLAHLNALMNLPGIGKKSAQRLILELKDKLEINTFDEQSNWQPKIKSNSFNDASEALTALGYNNSEIAEVFQKVKSSMTTEELIKFALKELNRFG